MLNSLIKTRASRSEVSRARSTGSQEEHFVCLTYWNELWIVYERHCHCKCLKGVTNTEKKSQLSCAVKFKGIPKEEENWKERGSVCDEVVTSLAPLWSDTWGSLNTS